MSDYPLKVLPPKMKEVGKKITGRVFFVDSEARKLEFTRKETLLKDKTEAF